MDGRVSPRFEIEESKKKVLVKMLPNGDVKGDGKIKIHRIPLCRTARCIVSYVTSPSCIWVKPINHITEQLQIRDLNTLVRSSAVFVDRYVMAPIEEGVYARARIREFRRIIDQKTGQQITLVKVLFIDEGTTAWLSDACLAQMDEIFAFHPWQAIAVALFKVSPASNVFGDQNVKWNNDDTKCLRAILRRYDIVRVEAVLNSVISNNYRDFIKVNIYGLEHEEHLIGTSIAELFVRERFDHVEFNPTLYDGVTQIIFEHEEGEDQPMVCTMELWKLAFPSRSGAEDGEGDQAPEMEWWNTERRPQIPPADVNWLNAEGYCNHGEYLVNVEGGCTVSPYEFYARLLPVVNNRLESGAPDDKAEHQADREEDAMIVANQQLASFAEELNSFYGHPKNRKQISSSHVIGAFQRSERVYGVVEVDEEIAQFTGAWQRVEVLACKDGYHVDNYFCRIRFLDSGGTDVRLLSSVLEIHPMHCVRPPLCIQMCLHGLRPIRGSDWSDQSKKFFIRELREDVPLCLSILGSRQCAQDSVNRYDCPPFLRSDVLFVSFIQVRDGSTNTLDNLLVERSHASLSVDSPIAL